jgi:hypothetical protein
MAWTYNSDGDGSDTRKIASMINAHNLEYQWRRQATYGITARESDFDTQFGQTLDVTNNEFLADLQGQVNSVRGSLNSNQKAWQDIIRDYIIQRASEEFTDVSATNRNPANALDGLILDMYGDTKSVEPSVISITPATNTHIFHSEIHAHASELSFLAGDNTVQLVEKVGDVASQTLNFEVTSPQTVGGQTNFRVYGGNAASVPDVAGGLGLMGTFNTRNWNSGGLLSNPNAAQTANVAAEEFAGNWRCFDSITSGRFDAAPVLPLATRNTTVADTYYGSSDIKWVGDNANATLYIAQLLANPLRNLDTTAWGSTANDSSFVRSGFTSSEGGVLVCSYYYRGVPTGYTLTPELHTGGNVRTADETIQGVTSDGSSTWRLAVYAFYVRAGDTDTDVAFALNLTNGGGNTSSSINVQIQKITLEAPSRVGNLWFIGVPSMTPKAVGAKDSFTLAQTSEGKWQKFFTKFAGPSTQNARAFSFPDVNGQAYQLPSNTTETELESLISIEDK